jgi:hypothetical protein
VALIDRCAGDGLGGKNQDSDITDHRIVFRKERVYAGNVRLQGIHKS